MNKYLVSIIEWGAHKILARVVTRAVQIIGEVDDNYARQYKNLAAPVLPQVEYRVDRSAASAAIEAQPASAKKRLQKRAA